MVKYSTSYAIVIVHRTLLLVVVPKTEWTPRSELQTRTRAENTTAGRRYPTIRHGMAGVCEYVRVRTRDSSVEKRSWQRQQQEVREKGARGARWKGRPPHLVVTEELEATMAVRLLAPWSLPTRLPARMPQELAYLVHRALPYAAILQSAPPEEHYSLCAREIPPGLCTRKQRLRGCLRVILPNRLVLFI